MIFAQIKNNQVVNCIVLDDMAILPLFQDGFDFCIRIDELNPRPGIGWSYIDGVFQPPVEE